MWTKLLLAMGYASSFSGKPNSFRLGLIPSTLFDFQVLFRSAHSADRRALTEKLLLH